MSEPGRRVRTVDEVHRSADRLVESVTRPGAELAEQRLQLAPRELDRIQVRRVRRQVQHASAGGVDEPADVGRLVGADVVEHDDVAGLQLAEEDALEEGLEDLGVGRAFDGHHGADAVEVESADHRRDGARVARNGSVGALAAWRAGVLPSHGDLAARLVDEDEPARVEALRKLDETETEGLYPGLALLYRREGLFFRVSASFSKTRFIDDRLTARPVRRWNSHATSWSVRSGFSPTIERTTSERSGATRCRFPAPPGRRTRAPVSRFNRFQRRTVASPTLNSAAASSSVIPARPNAATTRSRRSTEYAHPIATSRASPGAADQRRSITSTRQRCHSPRCGWCTDLVAACTSRANRLDRAIRRDAVARGSRPRRGEGLRPVGDTWSGTARTDKLYRCTDWFCSLLSRAARPSRRVHRSSTPTRSTSATTPSARAAAARERQRSGTPAWNRSACGTTAPPPAENAARS